jgi:hypothetical protein
VGWSKRHGQHLTNIGASEDSLLEKRPFVAWGRFVEAHSLKMMFVNQRELIVVQPCAVVYLLNCEWLLQVGEARSL